MSEMNIPFWYPKYLKSSGWRAKRQRTIDERKTCEICGESEGLQVHHLTYTGIFDELDEDLLLVCDDCHDTIHHLENQGVVFGTQRQVFVQNLFGWLSRQV